MEYGGRQSVPFLMFYLHVIHYTGFSCAQLFNSILTFLIVKRAGKLFGAYRHVMLVFTLCSMLFSWVEIVTQPMLYMKGPMFVVYLYHVVFSMRVGNFIASLHCATFGFLISVLAAQFFYRYCALCKPNILEFLSGIRLFLIFVPCLMIYVGWFELVEWGMAASLEKRELMRDDLFSLHNADSMRVSFIAALYWNTTSDGEKVWRLKDLISAGICTFLIITLSSLILFFALKIYFHMKTASAHMSSRTLELNRQLFVMLTVQTIVPFVTMYIPVGLVISLPLFDQSLGYFLNFPSASVAVYPAIEPLIAMYCIADFRKTIQRLFQRKRPKVRISTTWSHEGVYGVVTTNGS